ncbi:LysR family transcriptional regulator [Enterobacter asburiae]|uniref:LysR family transcriptional regulator n=1 Tax=Enterobacter asburiae TaxID=61645 RepID=UPI0020055C4E|nr:LysR family transcriptional regulator [Enterobacter asburiae]MCK7229461.1 LysR family transcriptional regulator [Enterobacter asburiae]
MSKKLKYFIICFETRCINYAADQLCVTRSPLARVLYELEEKMGGKLFIRKYNHLEPTDLALSLYDNIKPVYDLLCSIENEYCSSLKCSRFELLCDISVPFIIYQHFMTWLKNTNQPITCRRVSTSCKEIQSLKTNPNIGILSFREIPVVDDFIFHKFSDESLFILIPNSISDEALKNFDAIKNVKLFIRKDVFSQELKGIVSRSIRDFIPYVEIMETERDTASLLLSVSAGEGMMLLPECLLPYFSAPGTRTSKIPNIMIRSGLYVNKKNKSKTVVSDVMKMLISITKQEY